jgi:hypothetical protein
MTKRKCPYCAEEIVASARVCPHCEQPLTQLKSTTVQCLYCAEDILSTEVKCPHCGSVQEKEKVAPSRVIWMFNLIRSPRVLITLSIFFVLIGTLEMSPHLGLRLAVTSDSFVDAVNYCYPSSTQSDIENGVYEMEIINPDISPLDLGDNIREGDGTNEWLRCALRCRGNCDAMDSCIMECPRELLYDGFLEVCQSEVFIKHLNEVKQMDSPNGKDLVHIHRWSTICERTATLQLLQGSH